MNQSSGNVFLHGMDRLRRECLTEEEGDALAHYAVGVVSVLLTEEQAREALKTVHNCLLSSRVRENRGQK